VNERDPFDLYDAPPRPVPLWQGCAVVAIWCAAALIVALAVFGAFVLLVGRAWP
jgi:hypothetical protein